MKSVAVSWDAPAGRFVARGSHAAHPIHINAPREADETRGSTGFSATELLLAGAGACSAWDVLEMVRKRRHDIDSLDVTVEGEQAADPPWAYERVVLHFVVSGRGLRWNVLQRVVRLSVLRYCSVLATLSGVARIEATLDVISDDAATGRRAVPLESAPAPEDPIVSPLPETPAADED
ncbi:hypothetical protein BH23CHL6_BH23CHL6_05390 [soil metagenome]